MVTFREGLPVAKGGIQQSSPTPEASTEVTWVSVQVNIVRSIPHVLIKFPPGTGSEIWGPWGLKLGILDEQTDGWEKDVFLFELLSVCVKCGCTIDMFPQPGTVSSAGSWCSSTHNPGVHCC